MADRWDTAHDECRGAFEAFGGDLLTTWAVCGEAFHLLPVQFKREFLWDFIVRGGVKIVDLAVEELPRMRALMSRYATLPMDFADASLVALAERLDVKRVFTLDRRDFQIYRPRHTRFFHIFP